MQEVLWQQACRGPGTHSQGLIGALVPMVIIHSTRGRLPTRYNLHQEARDTGNKAGTCPWVQAAQRLPASQPETGSCSACHITHVTAHGSLAPLSPGAIENSLEWEGFRRQARIVCSDSCAASFTTLLVIDRRTTPTFSSYFNLSKKLCDQSVCACVRMCIWACDCNTVLTNREEAVAFAFAFPRKSDLLASFFLLIS